MGRVLMSRGDPMKSSSLYDHPADPQPCSDTAARRRQRDGTERARFRVDYHR